MLMKFDHNFILLTLVVLFLFVRISEGRLYQEINHCNSTNGYHCRNATAWSFCYQIGGRYFLLTTVQHCQEDHVCDSSGYFPCVFQQAPASSLGEELIILQPIIPTTSPSYDTNTTDNKTTSESLTTEIVMQNTSCEESTTPEVTTEEIYTTTSQNDNSTEIITYPEDHQSTSIDPVNTSNGSPTELHTSPRVSTKPPQQTDPPETTVLPRETDYSKETDPPRVTDSPEETDPPTVTFPPKATDPANGVVVTDRPKQTNPPNVADPPEETDPPRVTVPPRVTDPPKVTDPPTTRKILTTTQKHKQTNPPSCTDVGYFEGPECHQYWQCIRRWWWFVPLLQTCPDDQHFNNSLKKCVLRAESNCH